MRSLGLNPTKVGLEVIINEVEVELQDMTSKVDPHKKGTIDFKIFLLLVILSNIRTY